MEPPADAQSLSPILALPIPQRPPRLNGTTCQVVLQSNLEDMNDTVTVFVQLSGICYSELWAAMGYLGGERSAGNRVH